MIKKEITKVSFVKSCEEYPELDCIGEYTEKLSDGVIVRRFTEFYEKLTEEQKRNIPSNSRECRFFKPYAGGEKFGTDEYYEYGMQDYRRAEDYNNGGWCYLVVHAEAEVITPGNSFPPSGLINTIKSGCLGGIESDSDQAYFDEVKREELDELRVALVSFGFTNRQISKAFEDVEEVSK